MRASAPIASLALWLSLMVAAGVTHADQDDAAPASDDAPAEGSALAQKGWVDTGHDYVADRANRLVQWMDDFYGTEINDFESASSRIRVRFSYQYDEIEDHDVKARVRAKVQLPKISKRLALTIEGEDGDDFSGVGPDADSNEDSQVGLQYNFGDFGRNRIDGILSVNSSIDLRVGVRFRHDGQYSDKLTGRLVQDLAYQTGDRGAFSRTRLDGFRRIDDDSLLAWINHIEYGEDTYGVEWRTSLQWRERLQSDKVLSFAVGADGVTDPQSIVENYTVSVNYRSSIYRDYLFFELEPSHQWRELAGWDDRESVWVFTARFEVHFAQEPKQKKKKAEEVADPGDADPLAWHEDFNVRRRVCSAGCSQFPGSFAAAPH